MTDLLGKEVQQWIKDVVLQMEAELGPDKIVPQAYRNRWRSRIEQIIAAHVPSPTPGEDFLAQVEKLVRVKLGVGGIGWIKYQAEFAKILVDAYRAGEKSARIMPDAETWKAAQAFIESAAKHFSDPAATRCKDCTSNLFLYEARLGK